MKKLFLLFPNQLFDNHPEIDSTQDEIALIEDELFFNDHQYTVNFHKKKLMLHRATMQCYAEHWRQQGLIVHYFDWQPYSLENAIQKLISNPHSQHPSWFIYDCVDFVLNRRIKQLLEKYAITANWLSSPLFINSQHDNRAYRQQKNRWFMADFYRQQRRRLNILIDNDQPIGGKWSFDTENRNKIPKKAQATIPTLTFPQESHWIKEARSYVLKQFPQALGNADSFEYPINHQQAEHWLEQFLTERFDQFGPYEDALVPQRGWLYHSVLTPMLNTGLLSPQQVVDRTLAYAQQQTIPIASVEGFIRQIIGWREFMRATYIDLGVTMRTTNHWQHHRKIPQSFYTANTGIKPIDDVIQRVLQSAYCHHIERLMVLGGFMFLCEFDPDDIYQWFMTFFIDAYDWVMVPNVYAMSQNADGGLITTKPYFSGSSYLKKMGYDDMDNSHYDWCQIWDALYWRWISLHQEKLAKNPRWAMMCAVARKMDANKMAQHQQIAHDFLSTLNND